MKHFLIVYDRPAGKILELQPYSDVEEERALKTRFAREIELGQNPDIEVVLVSAESLDLLKKTHSRYFRTAGEIAAAGLA